MALTVIHMIEFRGAPGRHRRWWVLLGALVLAAVFTPWLYLVLAVGIGLGIGAMRRRPDAPKRFTWPAYAVVAILPVRVGARLSSGLPPTPARPPRR